MFDRYVTLEAVRKHDRDAVARLGGDGGVLDHRADGDLHEGSGLLLVDGDGVGRVGDLRDERHDERANLGLDEQHATLDRLVELKQLRHVGWRHGLGRQVAQRRQAHDAVVEAHEAAEGLDGGDNAVCDDACLDARERRDERQVRVDQRALAREYQVALGDVEAQHAALDLLVDLELGADLANGDVGQMRVRYEASDPGCELDDDTTPAAQQKTQRISAISIMIVVAMAMRCDGDAMAMRTHCRESP